MAGNRLSDIKTGYVRFVRGTPTAWEALTEKSNDTLYFISEKDAPSGLLYLGSKLISGGGDITINQGSTVKKLSKLDDVNLDIEISDGSVLTYDAKTKKWVNKKIETGGGGTTTIIQKVEAELMVGATEYTDGKAGYVPKPYFSDAYLYLRGDGTWSNPTESLEVEMMKLRQGDKDGSIREIAASEVVKIFGKNVPESYNTIEKIANWILLNGNSPDSAEGAQKLEALEQAVYGADKTSSTDGLIAVTKQLVTTIYGNTHESVEGLNSVCSRLEVENMKMKNDVTLLQKQYTALNTTVTDLDSRLTWKKY